jgi:hypothetical protein
LGSLTVIALLGVAISIGRFARVSYARAFFFATALVVLVLYVGALAGLLWWTALGLHVAGIVLLGREALRRAPQTVALFLSLPIGVLLLLCSWFWLVHGSDQYFLYDEYAHWGIFIKEMLALDALWTGETNSMHPRYPPGATLWQYLFNAFLPPSEGRIYFAHFVLLLAPLLMLWDNVRWSRPAWAFAILAIVLLTIANFGLGVSTLYVDQHVGVWYVGTLLAATTDKELVWRRVVFHAAALAVVALLKDVGLAFALSGALIIAVLIYRRHRITASTRRLREASAALVVLLVPMLLCTQTWSWNRDAVGAAHDEQSINGFVSGMADGMGGAAAERNAEIGRRLTEVFFDQQLSNGPVSWEYAEFSYQIHELFIDSYRLTTFGLLVAFVLWWGTISYSALSRETVRTWLIVAGGVFLTALVYIMAVHSSYRFSFGARGLDLPSYVRYMHTVALPMFLLSICPLLPAFSTAPDIVWRIGGLTMARRTVLFATTATAAYLLETPHLRPIFESNPIISRRVAVEPLLAPIRDSVGTAKLWIYMPGGEDSTFFGRMIRYLLVPTRVDVEDDRDFLEGDAASVQTTWRPFDYAWIVELPSAEARIALARFTAGTARAGFYRVRQAEDGRVALEHLGGHE